MIPETVSLYSGDLPACLYALAQSDPSKLLDAQRALLVAIRANIRQATALAHLTADGRPTVLICDRAELDLDAYVEPSNVTTWLRELGTSRAEVLKDYDAVLHLVTTAEGAEDHFDRPSPMPRSDLLAYARDLDGKNHTAWSPHPRFHRLDNARGWQAKLNKAMAKIRSALHSGD